MKENKALKDYYGFSLGILLINVLFISCVRSEVYRVGDDEGWTSDANYGSWSQKYNFSVGDSLVFKYGKTQHNVYEVTEETYRSCDASSGVIAKYESGNDEVKLNQVKKYWFICNMDGHCLGGMRFNIDVKASTSNNNNNTNSISDAPTEQPPPPSSFASFTSLDRLWTFFIYLLSFGALFILYH